MRVGILGGGQLARMLVQAGEPLGISFRVFTEQDDEATRGIVERVQGSFSDTGKLGSFAKGLDAVTFEFENVPAAALRALQHTTQIFPSARALEVGQDRAQEKALFEKLGIPTTQFTVVNDLPSLEAVAAQKLPPFVIKTTRLGYDGKGQMVYRSSGQEHDFRSLGAPPYIVENLVPFTREISIIGARSKSGEVALYPLIENHHIAGILRRSVAPAVVSESIASQAKDHFIKLTAALDYCGVLAIEFFAVSDTLIANEIAPRVHNSGHWTIDGAVTSQFENHLRAITGMPLGDTSARGVSVMVNCVGIMPELSMMSSSAHVFVHDYQKTARAKRKVGHVTCVGDSMSEVLAQAAECERLYSKQHPF